MDDIAISYFIGLAFDAHIRNMHGADFEVCENAVCRCAYALEQSRPTAPAPDCGDSDGDGGDAPDTATADRQT